MHRLGELLRRLEPEVAGHRALEGGALAAPVGAAGRRREPGEADVLAPAPVAGDQPERREPRLAAVRGDADAVEPGAAHDRHAPARVGAGAEDAEGVVGDRDRARPAARRDAPRAARAPPTGRSAPASRISADLGDGAVVRRRARRRATASDEQVRRAPRPRPSSPIRCGELLGPRTTASTAPSARTSARSVFELPPSTAIAIGSLTGAPPPAPAAARARPRPRRADRAARPRAPTGRSAGGRAAPAGRCAGRALTAASAVSRS